MRFRDACYALAVRKQRVVQAYPETIIDDRNGQTVTDYVTLTPRLVESIAGKYAVDMGRIYGTGHSMGAMATLCLVCNNPDLYAAVLIVDGQWDTSQLPDIATQKMIYIATGGDQSALAGQDVVKELLTSKDSSAAALVEVLKSGPISIQASDYGNFEKVGELGMTLPTNDRQIATMPGDVILYQGDKITVYYDTNSWNFTKLGHIKNAEGIKEKLGPGSVDMILSLD